MSFEPSANYTILTGAPHLVLGFFLMVVAAVLGAHLAAHWPERDLRLTGLAVGAGLGLVVVVVALVQGRLGFWLLPSAGLAVVGGWLGGWFVAHT